LLDRTIAGLTGKRSFRAQQLRSADAFQSQKRSPNNQIIKLPTFREAVDEPFPRRTSKWSRPEPPIRKEQQTNRLPWHDQRSALAWIGRVVSLSTMIRID
jgi:hypothetical protein